MMQCEWRDTARLAGQPNQSGVSDRKRGRKAANRRGCGDGSDGVIGWDWLGVASLFIHLEV